MRLAILGAGAVGPASAAIAASRGHSVTIWSPTGTGTAGLTNILHCEGVLEGSFPIAVAPTLEAAFAGADAALLALPAYALDCVLPRIAACLPPDLPLLIGPAASLAPVVLDILLQAAGAPRGRAAIGAMGTTVGGARRVAPDRVRLAFRRTAIDMAAVPAAAAPGMARLAEAFFGAEWPLSPDALHVSFVNVNPIAHAVMALTNVTRIERGEDWAQYAMLTAGACRLMQALAEERAAAAAAYGHCLDGLDTFFDRANQVPLGPLPMMTAAIAEARGDIRGPCGMETRYVTEDVPYGLAYYLAVTEPRDVPMPVTRAAVTTLELLWGRPLGHNPLLARLELGRLPELLEAGAGR